MLLLLAACYISTADLDDRLDQDGDDIPIPEDCAPNDPDVGVRIWFLDADGDDFGAGLGVEQCASPDGDWVEVDGDCDDDNDLIHPDAVEVCNGLIDDDCDALIDDDDPDLVDAPTWYPDADKDTFGSIDGSVSVCGAPQGYVNTTGDCDDTNDAVFPGADEVCNVEDDDCDGDVDEAGAVDAQVWCHDFDQDGWGDTTDCVQACTRPSAYVSGNGDCDDAEETVNPAQDEICLDGLDNDCDETVDSCPALATAHADTTIEGDLRLNLKAGSAVDAADLDGDGNQDLIIADVQYSDDENKQGAVYVVYGPLGGGTYALSSTSTPLIGTDRNEFFGFAVAGIPDLNRDSADELLVGAYNNEGGNGDAFLFLGSISPGDSQDDSDVWWSSLSASELGSCVASVGEVTGDSDGDFIIGARKGGTLNPGVVYIFSGADQSGGLPSTDADFILTGFATNDQFGFACDGAGDVNGDGDDDVLVGARAYDVASWASNSKEGGLALFMGPIRDDLSVTSADALVSGVSTDDSMGQLVQGAGDVDNDGYDDTLACATGESTNGTRAGACYLFAGAATPSWDALTPTAKIQGDSAGDLLGDGRQWRAIGDLDNDGSAEIMVGAPEAGSVYLFMGPLSGTMDASDADLLIDGAGTDLGTTFAAAGDQDGDGMVDLLLGAPRYTGGTGTGASFLFSTGAWF
jgi:hypothetical protein